MPKRQVIKGKIPRHKPRSPIKPTKQHKDKKKYKRKPKHCKGGLND